MKPIARIVTRMQGEGDGLMLGSTFPGQDFFKPNTVYEVERFCGVVTIREVGKACGFEKGDDPADRHSFLKRLFNWAEEVQVLLVARGSRLFMTREEFDNAHETVRYDQ